jgi:hypothetical protein
LIGKPLAAISLLCAVTTSLVSAQTPPAELWENDDTWILEVRAAGYNNYFLVRLTITELDEHRWSLGFLPVTAAPDGLRRKWHVVAVSKTTGSPLQAWSEDEAITVEHVDNASFVTGTPYGVPLEWLNANELPEGTLELGGKRTVTINKRTEGNKYLLEMIVMQDDVEQLRVQQTWVIGEKWWHNYERRVNGEVVLSARLLDPEAVKCKEADNGETAIIYSQQPVIARDPRLKGRIELIASHPKVEDVLNMLKSETGVKLTIDPALADKPPDLGDIELHSAVCWSVMNYVAARYPIETVWQKTEDGYALVVAPAKNEQPSWRQRWRSLAVIVGMPIVGVLGGALGFMLLRRSRKMAGQDASGQSPTPAMVN